MNVYILIHDDGDYDSQSEIRGVFATAEAAEASLVTRTASGRPSRAWGAHTANCCSVESWDVATEPVMDGREDDPVVPQTGGLLIPQNMEAEIMRMAMSKFPDWNSLKVSKP